MSETTQHSRSSRAGFILAASSALAILAMMHHPTGFDAGGMVGFIHGAMFILLGAQFWAMAEFTLVRRGSSLSVAGLVALTIALFAQCIAGGINGFAAPHMAGTIDPAAHPIVFQLFWSMNQSFAAIGLVASGLAIGFWSLQLLLTSPRQIPLGAFGLLAGGGTALGVMTGRIMLDVHGALIAYGGQAAWFIAFGLWLGLRRADNRP